MIKIRWGVIAGIIAFILSLAVGILQGNNLFYVLTRALVFLAVFFALGVGSGLLISTFIPELLYIDSDSAGSADSSGGGEGGVPRPGSRVNITLDGSRDFAMPDKYRNPDDPEEVGNISDLISGAVNPAAAMPTGGARGSGGMDHNREDGYTYKGSGGAESQSEYAEFGREAPRDDDALTFKEGQRAAAVFSPGFGGGEEFGGLPDLDAMAGAFLTNAGMDSGPIPLASVAPNISPPPGPAAPGIPAMPGIPEMPSVSATPAAFAASAEPAGPERRLSANKAQPMKGDFNPKELAEGIRTVLSKEP